MPERYRLSVPVGLWCTLRVGEILKLRGNDIRIKHTKAPDGADIAVGTIRERRTVQHIEGEGVTDTPKTEKGAREVHTHQRSSRVRSTPEHPRPAGKDELLFPSGRGGKFHHRTFGNWWNNA